MAVHRREQNHQLRTGAIPTSLKPPRWGGEGGKQWVSNSCHYSAPKAKTKHTLDP